MARINIESTIESHTEFFNLLKFTEGDRDKALGMLVRFFRLAQKAYGTESPITEDQLFVEGLTCMIEAGWAEPIPGGWQAKGASKQFGWYKQKVAAGKIRAKSKRDSNGQFTSGPPADHQRSPAVYQPPAPAPAPAPVKKQEERECERNDVFDLLKIWAETLSHFGIGSMPAQSDMAMLRILRKYKSRADVENALIGQRHEKDNPPFIVKAHLSLHRFLDKPKHFEKMALLGAGSKPTEWVTERQKIEAGNAV